MTYDLLRLAHILGLVLIGAGLVGVFVLDLRARRLADLPLFAEAVRGIAVFYDGLVVPGAVVLAGSGIWLTAAYHGGWAFLGQPWLAGMIVLFLFEFVEGNTVTRLYFMRLLRLSREAATSGAARAELVRVRTARVPTFTHFLDLPILFVIVALGVVQPGDWRMFAAATATAVLAATILTVALPRLYPPLSIQTTSPRAGPGK